MVSTPSATTVPLRLRSYDLCDGSPLSSFLFQVELPRVHLVPVHRAAMGEVLSFSIERDVQELSFSPVPRVQREASPATRIHPLPT